MTDVEVVDTGRSFDSVVETIARQLCKVLNVDENHWKQFEPEVRTKMIDNSIQTLLYAESRRLLNEKAHEEAKQKALLEGTTQPVA